LEESLAQIRDGIVEEALAIYDEEPASASQCTMYVARVSGRSRYGNDSPQSVILRKNIWLIRVA
jgi:hypothetical protein